MCMFSMPSYSETASSCSTFSLYTCMFMVVYIIYTISSIRLLILSQSAVFTMAATAAALPLTVMWWSLFHPSLRNPGKFLPILQKIHTSKMHTSKMGVFYLYNILYKHQKCVSQWTLVLVIYRVCKSVETSNYLCNHGINLK